MTQTFGANHRKEVKDTNAGNLVAGPAAAPTQARGIASVRGRRNDVVHRQDNGSARLVASLLNAAGEVGEAVSRESKRKTKLRGQNLAGTEEGREAVDEMSQAWHVKLFGPGAELRAAQERIVQNHTDDVASRITTRLDDGDGEALTESKFEDFGLEELEKITDKYDDEDIKDQITARFGRNWEKIKREHEKKHGVYKQMLSRQTTMDVTTKAADMAEADLASGDPQRIEDAKERLLEGIRKPEGMNDAPYREGLRSVVMDQLAKQKGALYEVVMESGALDGLSSEHRLELEEQKLIFDAKADEDTMMTIARMKLQAKKGGSLEQVVATGKQLQAKYGSIYEKEISGIVETAFSTEAKQQAEAVERREYHHLAATGDDRLGSKPERVQTRAMNSYISGIKRQGAVVALRNANTAQGIDTPPDAHVTAEQEDQYLLSNVWAYGHEWGKRNVISKDIVRVNKRIGSRMKSKTIRPEDAIRIAADVRDSMELRTHNQENWSRHVETGLAGRMVDLYEQVYLFNADPFEVLAHQSAVEVRRQTGTTVAIEPEDLSDGTESVVDSFINDKGAEYWGVWDREPENRQAIEWDVRKWIELDYGQHGDLPSAEAYALQRLYREGTMIGNRFISGGASLDNETVGKSYDRYLQGMNDSEIFRRNIQEDFGIAYDVDLRDDAEIVTVDVTNGAVTLHIRSEEGVLKPIVLPIPWSEKQILPTAGERAMDNLRETLRGLRDAEQLQQR